MVLYEIVTRQKPPERKMTKAFAVDYDALTASLPPNTPEGIIEKLSRAYKSAY